MAHILVVGRAFSGIKRYLAEHGHTYTVLQDKTSTKFPDKRFKNRVVADFLDEQVILEAVDTIHQKTPVDATFVTYERYVVPNAIIATHLGLASMSIDAAKACTDKELMRSLFAKAPEKISPDFRAVKSKDDLIAFASSHSFPLILKPANLSKSLLVTKSENLQQLLDNYERTMASIDKVYYKYAHGRTPKLLVEEFLVGRIHSVDVFVDADGEPHVLENVVDYQTGYDIGYDDNFHYSRLLPSRLSAEEIQGIRHAAGAGCKALGMTSSPAHVEIILTAEGPMVVEIGARNGGYRERMHALANHIDITENALALALNKPLHITPRANDSVGVFELFPRRHGKFIGIENLEKLQSLSSFNYVSVKAKTGTFVGKAGDGYNMCAVVILYNQDNSQFQKDVEFLNSNVSVIIEQ